MTCHIDNNAGHGKAGSARPELKPDLYIICTLYSDRGAMVDLSHESGPKSVVRPVWAAIAVVTPKTGIPQECLPALCK